MLGVALLLAGCDGFGVDPGLDEDGTATPELPLLQVAEVGGFAEIGAHFARMPRLTVYRDGRAIVPGPQIAIYPAPALPNLLEYQLSDAQLDGLVELARETDLSAYADGGDGAGGGRGGGDGAGDGAGGGGGDGGIADLPTTVVTLRVDGLPRVFAGQMLGSGDPLTDFVAAVSELVGEAEEVGQLELAAFGVLAWPAAEGGGGEIEPTVVQWPLRDVDLADAECSVVSGAQAVELRDALLEANTLTRFEFGDIVYQVSVRPLLPHEVSCADLG